MYLNLLCRYSSGVCYLKYEKLHSILNFNSKQVWTCFSLPSSCFVTAHCFLNNLYMLLRALKQFYIEGGLFTATTAPCGVKPKQSYNALKIIAPCGGLWYITLDDGSCRGKFRWKHFVIDVAVNAKIENNNVSSYLLIFYFYCSYWLHVFNS